MRSATRQAVGREASWRDLFWQGWIPLCTLDISLVDNVWLRWKRQEERGALYAVAMTWWKCVLLVGRTLMQCNAGMIRQICAEISLCSKQHDILTSKSNPRDYWNICCMAGLLAYLRVGCLLKDMLSSMACVADALHEIYSSGSAQAFHLIPF